MQPPIGDSLRMVEPSCDKSHVVLRRRHEANAPGVHAHVEDEFQNYAYNRRFWVAGKNALAPRHGSHHRFRVVLGRTVVDHLNLHKFRAGTLRQHALQRLMQKPRAMKCGNHHRPERSMHALRDRRKPYPVVAIGYHLSTPFGGQDALKSLITSRAWETG